MFVLFPEEEKTNWIFFIHSVPLFPADNDANDDDIRSTPRNVVVVMIEVILNDRLGKKIRVKCNEDDTIGDLKKLVAAQTGTRPEKIRCVSLSLSFAAREEGKKRPFETASTFRELTTRRTFSLSLSL